MSNDSVVLLSTLQQGDNGGSEAKRRRMTHVLKANHVKVVQLIAVMSFC